MTYTAEVTTNLPHSVPNFKPRDERSRESLGCSPFEKNLQSLCEAQSSNYAKAIPSPFRSIP